MPWISTQDMNGKHDLCDQQHTLTSPVVRADLMDADATEAAVRGSEVRRLTQPGTMSRVCCQRWAGVREGGRFLSAQVHTGLMPSPADAGEPLQQLHEPVTEEYVGQRDLTRWSRPGQWLVRYVLSASRFMSAHTVLIVSAAVGAVLITVLTAASAQIYDNVKDADGLSRLDDPVLHQAISLRSTGIVALVHFFTNLGGTVELSIITAVVVLVMVWRWRSWTPLILVGVGVAGSLLMTVAGKGMVGRVRPPLADAVRPYETSPSFPSGHTLNSTVIAGLVAYLLLLHLSSALARVLSIAGAVIWFVSMGLSRVFLGYHWLTDVMAGWTLGLAWLLLVITSHRLFLTVRRNRRLVEPRGKTPPRPDTASRK